MGRREPYSNEVLFREDFVHILRIRPDFLVYLNLCQQRRFRQLFGLLSGIVPFYVTQVFVRLAAARAAYE